MCHAQMQSTNRAEAWASVLKELGGTRWWQPAVPPTSTNPGRVGNFDFNYTLGLNSLTKTDYRTSTHVTQFNLGWLF